MILIYQVLIFKSCLLSILICTYTVLVFKKEMSLIQQSLHILCYYIIVITTIVIMMIMIMIIIVKAEFKKSLSIHFARD